MARFQLSRLVLVAAVLACVLCAASAEVSHRKLLADGSPRRSLQQWLRIGVFNQPNLGRAFGVGSARFLNALIGGGFPATGVEDINDALADQYTTSFDALNVLGTGIGDLWAGNFRLP